MEKASLYLTVVMGGLTALILYNFLKYFGVAIYCRIAIRRERGRAVQYIIRQVENAKRADADMRDSACSAAKNFKEAPWTSQAQLQKLVDYMLREQWVLLRQACDRQDALQKGIEKELESGKLYRAEDLEAVYQRFHQSDDEVQLLEDEATKLHTAAERIGLRVWPDGAAYGLLDPAFSPFPPSAAERSAGT